MARSSEDGKVVFVLQDNQPTDPPRYPLHLVQTTRWPCSATILQVSKHSWPSLPPSLINTQHRQETHLITILSLHRCPQPPRQTG